MAVTSELTLAEVLVKPFQANQTELQQIYVETLQASDSLTMVPISRTALIEAARLRAQHASLKLPDAIHAATPWPMAPAPSSLHHQRCTIPLGQRIDGGRAARCIVHYSTATLRAE